VIFHRDRRRKKPGASGAELDDPFASVWNETSLAQQRSLLQRVVAIAEARHTHLYLFWGTLVGHVREGRILPWDDDIDLALFDKSGGQYAELRAAFEAAGLRTWEHEDDGQIWLKVFDPSYSVYSDKPWSWPFVDIFIYSQVATDLEKLPSEYSAPRELILPGRAVAFEGAACWEPELPLALLDLHYPGWRVVEVSSAIDHRTEHRHCRLATRPITTDSRGRVHAPIRRLFMAGSTTTTPQPILGLDEYFTEALVVGSAAIGSVLILRLLLVALDIPGMRSHAFEALTPGAAFGLLVLCAGGLRFCYPALAGVREKILAWLAAATIPVAVAALSAIALATQQIGVQVLGYRGAPWHELLAKGMITAVVLACFGSIMSNFGSVMGGVKGPEFRNIRNGVRIRATLAAVLAIMVLLLPAQIFPVILAVILVVSAMLICCLWAFRKRIVLTLSKKPTR